MMQIYFCAIKISGRQPRNVYINSVYQGIQSAAGRKIRINARDKDTDAKDLAVGKAFMFCVPLDFEMLSSHNPFFQFELKDRLSYELTFNNYGNVVVSTDTAASYTISDTHLEFDVVTSSELAQMIRNKYNGQISMMTVPAEYEIWLPDTVKEILGIDDEGWLTEGGYVGDHAVEFSPQRIEIYLRQLNSSKNLASHRNETLSGSELLGLVPLSTADFGEFFTTTYENLCMKTLRHGGIHELD